MNNNLFLENRIGRIDKCDGDVRKTGQEMDMIRQRTLAYEYLCRLEEAKVWMEACLKEKLPDTTDIEENFRNGVYMAKLGHFIAPDVLPRNKIYDIDQRRYKIAGLQFKHTENIHKFLEVLKTTALPTTFQPETTDIYDKKNMPRLIYCIHALSTHLFKLGKAPLIQDVFGKAVFTDEQLDLVSKDLEKLNNTIPSFQKITGILSKRESNDINGLHNAILKLNELLETDESIEKVLRNKNLNLHFVCHNLCDVYKQIFIQAKHDKIQVAQNHSINDSYIPDEYDELLTQPEIQGHITSTNFKHSWQRMTQSARISDLKPMKEVFNHKWIHVQNFNDENLDFYCDIVNQLIEEKDSFDINNVVNWNQIYQGIINEGNKRAEENEKHKEALQSVNNALQCGTVDELYHALQNVRVNVGITRFAAPLYYEELKLDRAEKEKDLNESEIASSLASLSAIAAISEAVEKGDDMMTWSALCATKARVGRLRAHCRQRYASSLAMALKLKKQASLCPILTYDDIQDCIDMVNSQDDNNEHLVDLINKINSAVQEENPNQLMELLKTQSLNIKTPIFHEESILYMRLFKKAITTKETIWLDDIENVINDVYYDSNQVKQLTDSLVRINLALSNMKSDDLCEALTSSVFDLDPIEDKYRVLYFQAFSDYFKRKNKYVCPWVVCHTKAGNTVYVDIESYTHSWKTPKDFEPHSRYLSKKDVESLLHKIHTRHIVKYKMNHIERVIKKFQAHCRGYLFRKGLESRMEYFKVNKSAVVKIQAWWRMVLAKKKFGTLIQMKTLEALIKKRRQENPMACYKLQEPKIVKIQALWRGKRARRHFEQLFHSENPPFKVVKHFIPILDFSTEDYEKEIELQNLKSEVVQSIRKNQELSKHLDDMDVKIGLLVQNRITLQDVAAHGLKLSNLVKSTSTSKLVFKKEAQVVTVTTAVKGLKSLTKESKRLLDGYQNLFYELQTNPTYLSKLLFCIPQNKTNQFLQNVILTLYNFGANPRDEYLLLKLFRYSLEEEIKCKVSKPFDVISSNPIVLKMAVSHSRQMSGLTNLRNMIGPLVDKMVNDKDLNMETGPVEIFKAWRNEIEMKTGKISTLPLSVSQEEALSYPEVQKRLETALTSLKASVTMFIDRITSSLHLMPFCIAYMARVLHRCLNMKFPTSPEKEILKVVGNLVYYQYLNAAIVAPDAFHIIEMNSRDRESLTAGQRRNLASVAKILQFASAKKGFGDESTHLRCLNPFIVECHERLKHFFKELICGPSLEEYYCVDEYTEATLLRTPYIYITIQEIVDTHSLLVEYQDIIAPDPDDKLNILLEDLGEVPSAAELASREVESQASAEALARLDVCLALVNRFQHVADDMTDINKLFIRTKELCVSVMPYLNGEHLLEALCLGTTPQQNESFERAQEMRPKPSTIRTDSPHTLKAHIALLRKYIEQLEEQGYVSRLDGYQSLVTSIALDLCNKGKYRRAQRKALKTLRRTRLSLQEKTRFYEEQCRYYQQYVATCLDNLNAGKRSVHTDLKKYGKRAEKLKSKLTLKYNASKLNERGVLVEIIGLTQSQFKNVQFEITPTEANGVFTIRGKFLGVEMERVEIDIQDLLQKQYEGVTIIDIFESADMTKVEYVLLGNFLAFRRFVYTSDTNDKSSLSSIILSYMQLY